MQPPLFRCPVTRDISFVDLFGEKADSMPESERQERWEAWKATVGFDSRSWWRPDESCYACRHLYGDWCTAVGLPASVNPILSYRAGMPGFACMGAGHEPKEKK